jgi:hypothetical protein
MNASEEIFVVPGSQAPEVWRAQGKEVSSPLDSSKARSAGWVALPMRSLISLPMRFPAMAADRRESAVMLELEGLGIPATESDFQVEVRDPELREQRAWTVIQSGHLPAQVQQAGLDVKFAPSVAFRSLKRGETQVWEESGHLAIAVPDETGKPLHAQALTAINPDEDAAAEIRCILAALDLVGVTPEVNEIVVLPKDGATAPESLTAFAAAVGIPVSTEAPKPPQLPRESWRLLPPSVVEGRHQRKQRQSMFLVGAGVVLVMMALLGAFAGRLWSRENQLKAEITQMDALEPEMQIIRKAQEQWRALEPAVTPDKSFMEIFHQIAQLFPPEGITLQTFEIRDGHIIIQGVAQNQGLVNGLREDLTKVAAFSGLRWDFPNQPANAQGTTPFRADASVPEAQETASL